MKSIFSVLNKYKQIDLSSLEESKLIKDNEEIYNKIIKLYKINNHENDLFDLIKISAIIKSIKNEIVFENAIKEGLIVNGKNNDDIKEYVWKKLDELNAPYFIFNNARIYIPHFSAGLNIIFNDECNKIIEYPYSELSTIPESACIDLFDAYNFNLFESKFFNLKCVYESKITKAYYHDQLETIFVINEQGRLEHQISLFDRYLANKNKDNLEERIKKSLKFYFNDNRDLFIRSLYDNKFISYRVYIRMVYRASLEDIRKLKFSLPRGKSNENL